MATSRNTAVREALTFEKYTHSSCFLFLQCLALDKSLHLHCLLKHLYILIFSQKLYRPTNMYIVLAYLRNCIGKNTVKDSVEAPCQMSVVVSLPFNSRRPDTMFSNWAIKCSSLVLQTVFLESDNKITLILERREKKRREKGRKHKVQICPLYGLELLQCQPHKYSYLWGQKADIQWLHTPYLLHQ